MHIMQTEREENSLYSLDDDDEMMMIKRREEQDEML
jgi:hypothetical protein